MVGRICPRCQSFDVRAMTVQVIGTNRHAYVCHDCLCVFQIGADDYPPVSKVVRLPTRKRPKHR